MVGGEMLADYAGVTWKTQEAILATDIGPIPQGLELWKYTPLIHCIRFTMNRPIFHWTFFIKY